MLMKLMKNRTNFALGRYLHRAFHHLHMVLRCCQPMLLPRPQLYFQFINITKFRETADVPDPCLGGAGIVLGLARDIKLLIVLEEN